MPSLFEWGLCGGGDMLCPNEHINRSTHYLTLIADCLLLHEHICNNPKFDMYNKLSTGKHINRCNVPLSDSYLSILELRDPLSNA